ncbi:neuropeptide-like protein 28 [Cherax quadricarinatus]|uniref:neuropeptide-like protein 28 n=1 Tax=Cherax quadricarinatus TaxID=27406 RepID=UPI00387EA867
MRVLSIVILLFLVAAVYASRIYSVYGIPRGYGGFRGYGGYGPSRRRGGQGRFRGVGYGTYGGVYSGVYGIPTFVVGSDRGYGYQW